MNTSLLNVGVTPTSAAASTASASSAGNAAETAIEGAESDVPASPFAELLERAADGQLLVGKGDGDAAALPETEDPDQVITADLAEVAESVALPFSLIAPIAATPLPANSVLNGNAGDSAEPGEPAVTALVEALTETTDPELAGVSEPTLALPVAGKRLPLWSELLATSTPASSNPADTQTVTAEADSADSAWLAQWSMTAGAAASLEVAATVNRPELLAATKATADLVSVLPIAGPSPSKTEPAAATPATDAVPGLALRSPHFASLLGNQVLWQAKVGNSQAEIRIDPPDLGPIEVRISQRDSETHLHFVVGHQATRDQLEQALPRLRELFGQGGLQLGQVEVEHGRREGGSGQPEAPEGSRRGRDSAGDDVAIDRDAPTLRLAGNRLIDDYA